MNIAFYGPMCSGKTYLANYLINEYDYTRVGFSDKLKSAAKELFAIDIANKNDSTRRLLQGFADDIKKWGGEEIFIKHVIDTVLSDLHLNWVLDDLRYPAEAEALRKIGFKIIGVNCYETIRQERIYKLYPDTSLEAMQHRSETELRTIEPDYAVWSNKPDDVRDLEAILSGKRDTISLRR